MKKHRVNSAQPNTRVRTTLITVCGVALGLVLLNQIGLLSPLRIVTDQIFGPLRRVTTSLGRQVGGQLGLFGSINSIAGKNKQLNTEVERLKEQLASMREVTHENELLRNQLGFNNRQSLQLKPTRVVGYAPDNVRKFLTIDIGKSSGIKKGMAVVSNGALVGTIDEVFAYSSRVFLLSDTDFRIRGTGQDGRADGVVAGQVGSGYSMNNIAQGDKISIGETVITTGSDIIPKGIIIGTVESVERSDNAVFQIAQVRPAINLSKLELVFVVTGQK